MKLSRLISTAVDFAKHAKCVSAMDYADIKVNKWPDFLEKKVDE
jgi:hypothetical protein